MFWNESDAAAGLSMSGVAPPLGVAFRSEAEDQLNSVSEEGEITCCTNAKQGPNPALSARTHIFNTIRAQRVKPPAMHKQPTVRKEPLARLTGVMTLTLRVSCSRAVLRIESLCRLGAPI
jgi:hypothetical protein